MKVHVLRIIIMMVLMGGTSLVAQDSSSGYVDSLEGLVKRVEAIGIGHVQSDSSGRKFIWDTTLVGQGPESGAVIIKPQYLKCAAQYWLAHDQRAGFYQPKQKVMVVKISREQWYLPNLPQFKSKKLQDATKNHFMDRFKKDIKQKQAEIALRMQELERIKFVKNEDGNLIERDQDELSDEEKDRIHDIGVEIYIREVKIGVNRKQLSRYEGRDMTAKEVVQATNYRPFLGNYISPWSEKIQTKLLSEVEPLLIQFGNLQRTTRQKFAAQITYMWDGHYVRAHHPLSKKSLWRRRLYLPRTRLVKDGHLWTFAARVSPTEHKTYRIDPIDGSLVKISTRMLIK